MNKALIIQELHNQEAVTDHTIDDLLVRGLAMSDELETLITQRRALITVRTMIETQLKQG